MTDRLPSVARFEQAVFTHRHDEAVKEMLTILEKLNAAQGVLDNFHLGVPFTEGGERELYVHFATRFTAAFGALITAPDLKLHASATEALFILHRWRDMMFAVSGFQTSAHLLAQLPCDEQGRLILAGDGLLKLLLFFSPSSNLTIDFDECFRLNGLATVLALIGYLAARSCISSSAGALRDRILEWLPGKLDGATLGGMQLNFAAESYMHCSYANSPQKHRIKADFIEQMRRALHRQGASEMTHGPPTRERPRVIVVCEHFHSNHSVYRTHSRAVRALKERFEVIGLGHSERIDGPARECFHDLLDYAPGELIGSVKETADALLMLEPDMVFFLGVGMSNHAIALASLRIAPVQCVSYGHTATTMSPVIDYMILPDDFIGSDQVYSETLLRLPAQAMPYAPPHASEVMPPPRPRRANDGVVRIAVPASIMKINANFLQALATAIERASAQVELHFFPLGAVGYPFHHLDREIQRFIPGAIVNPQVARTTYLERLGNCDFFVSPFPYGNMNSIVDAMMMGVPGVCVDGPEAHSHADLAFFRRMGLPEQLCAATVDEYVDAIVRLIDDRRWRIHCQAAAAAVDLDKTIFSGDETIFARELLKLLPVPLAA